MSKVTYKSLISANVRVDNSVDTERVYDIAANARIGDGMMMGMGTETSGNQVSGMDSGEVKRKSDGVLVATFYSNGSNHLSIDHQNTEADEQCTVTNAINAYIDNVKAMVTEVSPLSF